MNLKDFAAQDADAQATERKEIQSLKAQVRNLTLDRDRLRTQLGAIEALEAHGKVEPPRWLVPKNPPKGNRATLCLLLTDAHLDEVVDPAQVDGINAYNREIAELRLERLFERTVRLARHYLAGVKYDGAVLFLGGDIFSGNIHEELQRTNADTLFGSLLYWLGPIRAGVEMLAKEFGRVHVAGVPGNHGRLTRKPIAKQRAADNLDWLLYRLLARELAGDSRITWEVPTAADAHVQVYNTRFLLTHGDQFRGGSGISGALAPLLLGSHRKTRRQTMAGRPYEYMVMGHFHQSLFLPSKGLLAGGSVKGMDEYSYVQNYEPEAPQQALWLVTPEHGLGWSTNIHVGDRKAERW